MTIHCKKSQKSKSEIGREREKGKRQNYERAFSLIEMLFVVVIIAILAAIVIPRVGRGGLYDKFKLYTTAHQIGADLRMARRLAVTTGASHRVQFFTNASADYNEYRIQTGVGWSNITQNRLIADDIAVTGDGAVTFSSTGTADTDHNFNYTLSSYHWGISVKSATGRVKMQEY